MQIDRPITIAICLFIVLLLIFFLVMPEYNTFKDLRFELGKKRAEYNAEYEYFSEIARLYKEIQSRKEALEKIDDALPGGSNFGNLVYYFQNQASADGLIIKSLSLSKSSSPNTSKSSPSSGSDSDKAYQQQINMSERLGRRQFIELGFKAPIALSLPSFLTEGEIDEALPLNERVAEIFSLVEPLSFDSKGNLVVERESKEEPDVRVFRRVESIWSFSR